MPEKLDKWTVKRKLQERRLCAYEVADYLNITESALSKRLRAPTQQQVEEVLSAIDRLAEKKTAV